MLKYAIIFGLVSVIILITVSVIYTLTTKSIAKHGNYAFYDKVFSFLYDFPLGRRKFRKLYEQVAGLSVYNHMQTKVVTVKNYVKSLSIVILACGGSYILFRDIISMLLLAFTAVLMLDSVIYSNINKQQDRITVCIKNLLPNINDGYVNYHNIPDALKSARVPPLLKSRVDAIVDIVTSSDGETKLLAFDMDTPNRLLQMLAKACFLHNNSGESVSADSPFRASLRMIQDEVNIEYKLQFKRNLLFKFIQWLPVIMMAVTGVMKVIMPFVMAATQGYFNTPISYVATVIQLVVDVACYYVVSTINNPTIAASDDRIKAVLWLWRFPKMQELSKRLVPTTFKKRHQQTERLKGCVSSKTLDYWYFEQLCLGVTLAVVGFILTFIILSVARTGVYNSLASASMTSVIKYTVEDEVNMRAFDHQVLAAETPPDAEELGKAVKKIMPRLTSSEREMQVSRILLKYKMYHGLKFKWWFAFIYIALFFAGVGLSRYLVHLRVTLVRDEAETDVLQMQTMITILMNTNLDLHKVIYWLMHTSVIFKGPLTTCYYTFWRDPYKALKTLSEQSNLEEFKNMCLRLTNTIDKTSIQDAFADLITDREITLDTREMSEMNALSAKRSKAGSIAMLPVGPFLILSIILPLAYCAFQTFQNSNITAIMQ